MTGSHFRNASGWPEDGHVMSARDLVTLSRRIIDDFPEYYVYFQETEFTWNGITQPNRNPLLKLGLGVDGLKTGHTAEAGYGLVGSAVQNGQRMIFMVGGLGERGRARRGDPGDREMGLRRLRHRQASTTPAPRSPRPRSGSARRPQVALVAPRDLQMLVPREERSGVKARVLFQAPIEAPIAKGQKLGALEVAVPGHDARAVRPRRRRRRAARRADDADQRRGAADPRPRGQLPARPLRAWPGARFISFEGIDGSGKSTQVRALAATLRARGAEVVETREPGGAPGAELIRGLLVEGDTGRWSPETEILLFTAARRDHLERTIRPALDRGATVVCDRFAEFDPRLPGRGPRRAARHGRRAARARDRPRARPHPDPRPAAATRPPGATWPAASREDRFERFGTGLPAAAARRASSRSPPSSPPAAASSPPAATPTRSPPASPPWSGHERARGARPAAGDARTRARPRCSSARTTPRPPISPPPRPAACRMPGSSPARAASARRRSPGASPAT